MRAPRRGREQGGADATPDGRWSGHLNGSATGAFRWGRWRRLAKRLVLALPGNQYLRHAKNIAGGGDGRTAALLRLRAPRGLMQPSGFTSFDRYPEIFEVLLERFGADAPLRVLSFGCSTGEEIATILAHFPHATVKGIDIDRRRLGRCRERFDGDGRVSLAQAGSAAAEPPGSYDLVTAFAVLRHGDLNSRPATCAAFCRFETFAAVLRSLVAALKPAGVLAVRHANFRVGEVAGARDLTGLFALPASGPFYDANDRLAPDGDETVLWAKGHP